MTAALTELLRAHPLPAVDGDKSDRGTAVIVAGEPSCPGAALLAATAALRVGAGKVQILTHPEVVSALGVAMPEALVVPVATDTGTGERAARLVATADTLLVGPGLGATAPEVARALCEDLPSGVPLILDAQALPAAPDLRRHELVLIPNQDEAADLAGGAERVGAAPPEDLATHLAGAFDATVAVRGATTSLTDGDRAWTHHGQAGLGTSGSGDVLAGLVAGLCARGVPPLPALGWAVGIHSTAGRLLARGTPGYGYLARELLTVVPTAIVELAASCGLTDEPA
jgi:hydroxyethylthiazole kinase-like uncharacterized protein yjeF